MGMSLLVSTASSSYLRFFLQAASSHDEDPLLFPVLPVAKVHKDDDPYLLFCVLIFRLLLPQLQLIGITWYCTCASQIRTHIADSYILGIMPPASDINFV